MTIKKEIAQRAKTQIKLGNLASAIDILDAVGVTVPEHITQCILEDDNLLKSHKATHPDLNDKLWGDGNNSGVVAKLLTFIDIITE